MRSQPRSWFASVGCCLILTSTAWAQTPDLQMGEQVLAVDKAPADAPKRRGPDHPWVELSNLRKAQSGPFPTLDVDYKVTGDSGSFELVLKSERGRQSTTIHVFGRKQDTISLRSFGFQSFPDNVEVWAETDAGFGPFSNRIGYKISKSLTIGSVGQLSYAREWKPEEKTAYELSQKAKAPPPPAPEGYVVLDANTTPLLPGMPVLAAWMAEWHEGELLSSSPQQITVKWAAALQGRPTTSNVVLSRAAIAKTTLEIGKKAPETFKPSMVTLQGGAIALTDDLVPLTADVPVVPGTPLKAEWGGKWDAITATAKIRGDEVPITWDNRKDWNENRKLTMVAIEKSVLERLKQPDAKEFYAARLDKMDRQPRPQTPPRDYAIRLQIPKNGNRLKDDLFVPEGTTLNAVWGNKWYQLKVMSDSEEGPVECQWDGFGNRVEWINRSSLVITKADESKIKAQLRADAAAKTDTGKTPGASTPTKVTASSTGKSGAGGDNYELVLESVGSSKIKVAKVVMDIADLELKDALELASELPIAIKSGLSEGDAKALLKEIEAAGGKGKVQAAK